MEDFLPFTGQNGVIIYSQKFAEEQSEAAKRWMVAYLKGTRAYLDAVTRGPIATVSMRSWPSTPRSRTSPCSLGSHRRDFDPNGRLEIKSLEGRPGLVPSSSVLQQGRADLGRVIDYQYLDYAVSRLGTAEPSAARTSSRADTILRDDDRMRIGPTRRKCSR